MLPAVHHGILTAMLAEPVHLSRAGVSQAMDTLLPAALNGLSLGCVYGLVALGFALIYKATGVMNFAQGELMMLGAYLHYSLVSAAGLSPLAAVPVAVVLAGLLGASLERGLLHPLVDEPPLAQVMATIGLATVLRAGTGMIWQHHPNPRTGSPTPAGGNQHTRLVGLALRQVLPQSL